MSVRTAQNTAAARRRAAWIEAQKGAASDIRRLTRRAGRLAVHLVPTGLLGLAVLGGVLRLTVQDSIGGIWAYAYYATPPAVLAGLALLAAASWSLMRRWRSALWAAVSALACLAWSIGTTWYRNSPAPLTGTPQRIMFWNLAYGEYGWERAAAEIRRHGPDLVGLVEAHDPVPDDITDVTDRLAVRHRNIADLRRFWREQLPGYEVDVTDTGIALLSRREATLVDYGELHDGWCVHWEVGPPETVLHVIVVDVQHTLGGSRLSPLRNLYTLLEKLRGQSVLVMGDFNTPADSVLLQPLRRGFANAFEVAGNGYAATWPRLLPVLTIDQMWYNEGVQVGRCELGSSRASDHRFILAEIVATPQ